MLKLAISSKKVTADAELLKYIDKKIGSLDKYLPKHATKSAHAELRLSETKAKDKKQCHVEVVLHLPGEVLTVKDSTMNMYAAIDIVEAKLKNQIVKYKDQHSKSIVSRRRGVVRGFLGKIRSR